MRLPMLYPASLLLAGVALPLPLAAQEVVQPLPGTTDADKLADLVRQIGRNPRDVRALVDAGDLSAKLGDTTAAASLYKRASQVDPNNARVQAGIARILVNGEHPGEALRYFNQAERAGLSPALFADDRGLAYDLIGEQERAQRDYRLALARPGQDNEDEVRRRYALSLGISGRKDEALQQIDALLRKSDRGAWRARAFILAMNGDATGANTIATTMMPRGMAGGLAAFFTRLPTLSAADRAFAVHFGEVTPTPERIADARLVPALPALAPDPYARTAGVQVAAQTATPVPSARGGRGGRDARQAAVSRGRSGPAERVAAVTTTPAAVQPLPAAGQTVPTRIAQASLPVRPIYAPQSTPLESTQPQPITPSSPASTQVTSAPPATSAQLAQPSPVPSQVVASAPTQIASVPLPARVTYSSQAPAAGTSLAAATETRTILPATTGSMATAGSAANAAAQANNAVRSAATAVVGATGSSSPLGSVASSALTSSTPASIVVAASTPAAPAIVPGAGAAGGIAVSQPVQVAAVTTPSAPLVPARPSASPRIENEDTILARIVANISIPASELGVAPMPGAAPQPGSTATIDEAAVVAERNAAAIERRREREASAAAEPRVRAVTPARAATQTASSSTAGDRRTKGEAEPASSKTRRGAKTKPDVTIADTDEPAAGRRSGSARTRKGSADEPKLTPKQVAAKAKADAKELADAKAAAAEKKAARSEPERYWVQVAGGATQADLNKAWKGARAKSSLLARRAGYTTPLRATNRVVTGPFKTQAEAQAMVNKLSKDGVSAFTFTSEAGQRMSRLGEK